MSDMKFTPGRWEVRIEQIAPGSNETCFTVATDEFDVVSPLLGIRNEWDAELIAAARDMYEALQQAITSMQDSGYQNSHVVIRAGKAALAKARGES